MSPPSIEKLTIGRYESLKGRTGLTRTLGVGQPRPTISWRFEQTPNTSPGWAQSRYEISITRGSTAQIYAADTDQNVHVPWPTNAEPLGPRESAIVAVRARGQDDRWTEWCETEVEAALFDKKDWEAEMIAPATPPPANLAKRPFYARQTFALPARPEKGDKTRVYATAFGIYSLTINGHPIGDHVQAPGWQSYNHRLHYQTYSIPAEHLVEGENMIEAVVGEGWYAGRLTWNVDWRNFWGEEPGVMAQLELNGQVVVKTDPTWQWSYGPLLAGELYDGEIYDATLVNAPRQWGPVKTLRLPSTTHLIAPESPPIRRTQELSATTRITTPSGKKILDFGQNLVGWVKVKRVPPRSETGYTVRATLRFAEVLELGELGTRPLRSAKCTDQIFFGDGPVDDWEPKFTTHGFRYCEVTGLEPDLANFTAVVVHTDMERIGDFSCSHEMVNKLHENIVWGWRGNAVGLPTDCPQRDERLGWTGDLQAFAPTASFLYDTAGFLANWLHDVSEEQLKDNDNMPPLVVPNTLTKRKPPFPPSQAVWGDVCVLAPEALYDAHGSDVILEESYASVTAWLDKGIQRGPNGLWLNERGGFQLSDWLDPRAPPDDPGAALTDQFLVADAFLIGVTQSAARIAGILGHNDDAERYTDQHATLRKTFQNVYLSPSGRLSSDQQTAYALGIRFGLFDKEHLPGVTEQLYRLAAKNKFRISTGFAGTPAILPALTQCGHLQLAYRMLQEKGCPSWLYPVTMGATTVWERWDSLLPNGDVNPGEMTSFNHYALGAVAEWLYSTVAGLVAAAPGWKKIRIQPRPGGTIRHAKAYHITPYGRAAVSWRIDNDSLTIEAEVPPNTTAEICLPGQASELVGSGFHTRVVSPFEPEGEWPPKILGNHFNQVRLQDTLAE